MPHAALYVVQPDVPLREVKSRNGFNAARSILCGATSTMILSCMQIGFNAARSILCGATVMSAHSSGGSAVSMPHAALYVVQQVAPECICGEAVSMPHAAFYVVQPKLNPSESKRLGFNAARSILCGATSHLCTIQ